MPGNGSPATLGASPRYFPFEGLTSSLVFLGLCEQLNDIVLPDGGCNPGSAQRLNHSQVIEDFLHFRII